MNENSKESGEKIPASLPQPPPSHPHHPDYVFPLILIALGVIFLVSQLGVSVNWGVVWPAFLIVLGLGIILSRGRTPGWLVAIVVLIIFALIAFSVIPLFIPGFPSMFGGKALELGEMKTSEVSLTKEDLNGAKDLLVLIEGPVGLVNIRPDSSLDHFALRLITRTNIIDFPSPVLAKEGDTYALRAKAQEELSWFGWVSNWENVRLERDLSLNTTVPLNLQVKMTSGDVNINTTGIPIEAVLFNMTSGSVSWDAGTFISNLAPQLDFGFTSGSVEASNLGFTNFSDLNIGFTSGRGKFTLQGLTPGSHRLKVNITSGVVEVLVPKGTGYQLEVKKTSGNVVVDGRALEDKERVESQNFATALVKLEMDLHLTSGTINVVFTDNF